VLFLRRCHGAYVVGVTGLRDNDDAGFRSSDVHETGVTHRISRSHLISAAQQMQEAAVPTPNRSQKDENLLLTVLRNAPNAARKPFMR
jgi:hypothetical protein